MAKLYRMRSAGKTDRRSLAGSILFISGQDGGGRANYPQRRRGLYIFFFVFVPTNKVIPNKKQNPKKKKKNRTNKQKTHTHKKQ
ncbi:hypothetical protein QQG42_02955, partial [Klebsiella pneumoniae]|uniref:hypothetical protein n=1 Tax=Klebsiella pneumoniae TaxID=573 RepID=UPI00345A7245